MQTSLNRRQALAWGAGSALLSSCRRRRATGFPGLALVAAGGENCLSIVDLNTFHLRGKTALRGSPGFVAADRDRAYVLTPANGTVHILDPEAPGSVESTRLADQAAFLRLTPLPGQYVAASRSNPELTIAQAGVSRVERRVKLSTAPADLDVRLHVKTRRLLAALSGGAAGTVELVDLQSGKTKKRQLDGELGGVRFRDDGQLLFVANWRDSTLLVLDGDTLGTVCELSLPMRPDNFAFTADRGQLFISGRGMDGISIIYVYDTLEVEQTVLAGRAPGAMVCSGNPRYLFVASRAGSEVSILSVENRKLIAMTEAGQQPVQIAVTPDQQYALVLNRASGDLAAIRIGTIRPWSRHTTGAALFAMIPVGVEPANLAIYSQRRV